ncbi:MAG: hypothetical protein AB8G26_10605 [Ilumatobacter sp.]
MLFDLARLGPRLRWFAARHRHLRLGVAVLVAVSTGLVVHAQLRRVDEARAEWSETREVQVANAPHAAGDPIRARLVELPLAAIPDSAVTRLEPDQRAMQRIGTGEVLTTGDLTASDGPAALAAPGLVVVPVSDPILADSALLSVGLDVAIVSDGVELSDSGRITAIDADVVFVALPASDVAAVATAAQQRSASLVFPGS